MTKNIALAAALVCSACPSSGPALVANDPVEPLAPPAPDEGFQVALHTVAPPGSEIWRCEVLPALPGDDVFHYVHRVESRQNAGVHHADLATLFFAPDLVDLPLEIVEQVDCADIYAQHPSIMEDGVIVYGAQQANASIVLPDGVAAAVPRDSGYLVEVHYVNVTDTPVDVAVYINAYTMAAEDVVDTIWGDANRDFDINVPAGAVDHLETTKCTFNADAQVLFLSSHTHELATRFEIRTYDGATDQVGALVYENTDWHSPEIKAFDPPLTVRAGEGFEYTCFYSNPRDVEVHWGNRAEDEMCQFAYVFTPGDSSIKCE